MRLCIVISPVTGRDKNLRQTLPESPGASQAANSPSPLLPTAAAENTDFDSLAAVFFSLTIPREWRQRSTRFAYLDLDPTSLRLNRLRPAPQKPQSSRTSRPRHRQRKRHILAILRDTRIVTTAAHNPQGYIRTLKRAIARSRHHVERRGQQSLRKQLRSPGFANLILSNSELADFKRL